MTDGEIGDGSTVAERLADAMGGLSRYALWKKSGVSQSMIGRLLNGQRHNAKPQTFDKLARALGVRMEWLATGQGPREPQTTLEALLARATPLDLAIAIEGDRISETARSKVLRWAEKTAVELDSWGWIALLRDVQQQLLDGVPASRIALPDPSEPPPKMTARIEKVS